MELLKALRIASAAQVALLLFQSGLAGRMIAGNVEAAHLHRWTAGVLIAVALVQFTLLVLLRVQARCPRWIAASGGLLVLAEVAEIIAGRFHNVSLHIPLGVALFGGGLRQLFWAVKEAPAPVTEPR